MSEERFNITLWLVFHSFIVYLPEARDSFLDIEYIKSTTVNYFLIRKSEQSVNIDTETDIKNGI